MGANPTIFCLSGSLDAMAYPVWPVGRVAWDLRNHTNSRLVFAGVGSLGIRLEGDTEVTLQRALPSVNHVQGDEHLVVVIVFELNRPQSGGRFGGSTTDVLLPVESANLFRFPEALAFSILHALRSLKSFPRSSRRYRLYAVDRATQSKILPGHFLRP